MRITTKEPKYFHINEQSGTGKLTRVFTDNFESLNIGTTVIKVTPCNVDGSNYNRVEGLTVVSRKGELKQTERNKRQNFHYINLVVDHAY